MKTEVMFHCGNAPKMERVIDLTIALATKEVDVVKRHVREDFVWKAVGMDEVVPLAGLADALDHKPSIVELKVENALSHGNGAMCEGTLSVEDGGQFYYCNVVRFVNTTKDSLVREAHTYLVKR